MTEKYLNDLRNYVLGLVPEERDEVNTNMFRLQNQGWNAAREEMIKRINEADFEPLIRTTSHSLYRKPWKVGA
jgi:hypothetical protein